MYQQLISMDGEVHELEIPRVQAEKALAANGGDVVKTLVTLVS